MANPLRSALPPQLVRPDGVGGLRAPDALRGQEHAPRAVRESQGGDHACGLCLLLSIRTFSLAIFTLTGDLLYLLRSLPSLRTSFSISAD